ncbi:MAG: hypothetical protein KUG78_18490 [Kangiellaceae bacterium]|nr:hypothetical protein [Kangiellaceae bacterium]
MSINNATALIEGNTFTALLTNIESKMKTISIVTKSSKRLIYDSNAELDRLSALGPLSEDQREIIAQCRDANEINIKLLECLIKEEYAVSDAVNDLPH